MSNGDPISAGTTQNVTDEADAEDGETNHIIKYYGETQTTTGTLTVTKTVSGLDSGAVLNTETFEIYVTAQGASDPAYTLTIGQTGAENITYSVDDNGVHTWTISNVPLGEYSVTETGTEVSGYTLNTSASTTTGNAKLDADNLMPTVDLINSYTKNTYGLSVTKSVSNTGPVADETELTYTVTVKNDSNVVLESVVVTDTLWGTGTVISVNGTVQDPLTGNSYTIASIAAGASVTITYEYTVNDNASHQIINTAEASVTVEGEEYSGDATATVTVGYTDVSVTKALTSYTRDGATNDVTDDASFVAQVGDVLNYTVTITNNGNTAATGSVTDTFEVNGEAAELVWGDNVSVSGGVISFENLAANSTITITASYTVKEGDKTITNSVTGGDTVTTDVAALSVTKTTNATNNTVKVGDTIVYTIEVENVGGVALTNVAVSDNKWTSNTTISVPGDPDAALNGDHQYIIESLAVGESVTITYSYEATANDVEEGITNTATAMAGDITATDDATVTVTPQYVLTVNSYYESTSGTLFDTDTYTLDAGANWSVVIRPETDGTHVAPATVTDDDGNNYVFDEDLSDDDLSGTIGREDVTVNLVYSLDNWKDDEDGDDSETGGDGEPDYKQALIKYVVAEGQDGYGSVTPAIQVETLADEDEDGTYTGNVTASSIATANEDYAFDYWTDPDGETSWNAELSDNFTATGGGEYTYTAYFDTDTNNDDIPDKYQVFVNFKSADETVGTVTDKDGADPNTDTTQVYTFADHATSGSVTPTLDGVDVTPATNYDIDYWTKDEGPDHVTPTDTLDGVEGGDTITFYAHFKGTNSVYTLDKALSAVDGAAVPQDYKAQVGDVLTYTITVTNEGNTVLEDIILTDTFNGAGELVFDEDAAGYTIGTDSEGNTTITIASLPVGEKITITYTYTVVAGDIGDVTDNVITVLTNTVSSDTDGDDTPDITDEVKVNMDTYTVEIAPANIVVYTGGNPYGGITNEEGDLVVEEDDIEANGLPEPGYHIELSQAVMDWLNIETGEEGARDLTDYLSFQYQDDVYQREWKLEYMGVYSTDPTRYVYSMSPTDPSNPEVRVVYTDAAGIEHFDDDITMDENTVSADYTMEIYGGELEQHDIVAVLTVNDEYILAGVDIGEGTLTIRSDYQLRVRQRPRYRH